MFNPIENAITNFATKNKDFLENVLVNALNKFAKDKKITIVIEGKND